VIVPAILFFIVFALILLMISQTGVFDSLSSIGSVTASQEQMIVPANGTRTQTPTPTTIETPLETTIAPTTPSAIKNAKVTSIPTPIMTNGATTTSGARKNIVETLEADGRFTTFITAVKAAELDGMLRSDTDSGSELYTVFAPTDDAFKNYTDSMDPLLQDPQGDLLQILLYHVVSGKVTAVDLEKLTSIETLQGGTLSISVSNGIITVDGANVILTNMQCSNGVIHVVDTVMLPPA